LAAPTPLASQPGFGGLQIIAVQERSSMQHDGSLLGATAFAGKVLRLTWNSRKVPHRSKCYQAGLLAVLWRLERHASSQTGDGDARLRSCLNQPVV